MGNHIIDPREPRIYMDSMHWCCQKMDSYDKTWNFCISAREPGKSTRACRKIWKKWTKKHERFLVLRRRPIDLTEGYINSLAITINKFLPCHKRINFYFSKGSMRDGQVDIYIDKTKKILVGRVQALNIPSARAKSNIIRNVSTIIYDEYIPNDTREYLSNEVMNLQDVYSTYYREYNGHLKVYFFGNPYTVFNPFHSTFGIDITKIVPGAFLVGEDYVLEFPVISAELREYILKRNPLYKFDDEYTRYALNGIAIHDAKYNVVSKKPEGLKLAYVFRVGGNYLLAWKSNGTRINMFTDRFWIESQKNKPETTKNIYSIDFDNLVQDTRLINSSVRVCLQSIKEAVARRNVAYKTIESAVLIENLYKVL